jgi:predicted outer membrane repeat protein
MAYSQSGLIEATDYNNFVGTSPSSTVNTINTVWSVGSGSAGYGQTALSTVSAAGVVTATQWATAINTLNSILTHQSGSGSGISATTAGTTINYLSTLSTNITTSYTNRLTFASNSAAVAGGALSSAWTNATTVSTLTRAFGARAAFASADQARYFFNSGGRLKLNCSGTQNASTTGRTNDIISMLGFLGGVGLFAANTNAGRLGTGGTLGTNATTIGYHTSTYNANVTLVSVTSTVTAYAADTASITVITNGTQGTNNDKGLNVDYWITLNSTQGTGSGFDDSIGVNVIRSIDVSYPELTNLTANTWGAVTITSL